MRLLLATTRQDRSRELLLGAALERGLEPVMLYYEDLRFKGLKREGFRGFDYAILRDPFNTGVSFLDKLEKILSFFRKGQVLDYKIVSDYLRYEDKLSQKAIFKGLAAMPRFWHFKKPGDVRVEAYPVILKKRVSSRGRGIYVIHSKGELERFLKGHDIRDYFVEERIEITRDVRILLIGREIAGAVNRRVRLKDNQGFEGIGVKASGDFEVPDDLKAKSVELANQVGSDFCGLDFVFDQAGQAFLLECNVSPQFIAIERELGLNAAGRLMDFIKGIARERP